MHRVDRGQPRVEAVQSIHHAGEAEAVLNKLAAAPAKPFTQLTVASQP